MAILMATGVPVRVLVRLVALAGVSSVLLLAGCKSAAPVEPEYDRQLPPGTTALRPVPFDDVRDQAAAAFRERADGLADALDQSLIWFAAPSSRSRFPFQLSGGTVTHERARASVEAFRDLLASAPDEASFLRELDARFQPYATVGWDGSGTVLFTGYYAPIYLGSTERRPGFEHPLYTRPDWLVATPDGKPIGRRLADGSTGPSPTRAQLEASGELAGTELVWLSSKLDAFVAQVNGSARIDLVEGRTMFVGYGGKTERPYTGLGRSILDAGILEEDELSLARIESLYRERPALIEELMAKNESFVFFTEYGGDTWPAGSLGVPVTTEASIATDKSVYPPGCLALVKTTAASPTGGRRPFTRFMLDQDTGGAIVAPGRCDLFMGIGPDARTLAGAQYAEGTMWYLFLKDF